MSGVAIFETRWIGEKLSPSHVPWSLVDILATYKPASSSSYHGPAEHTPVAGSDRVAVLQIQGGDGGGPQEWGPDPKFDGLYRGHQCADGICW
jgi:hypothetical protein